MAWLIAAIIGGIVGLIYGAGVAEDRRLYALVNFVVGAIGGILGVWFFFLVLGIATASVVGNILLGILWAIIGAIILVAIVDAINYAIVRSSEREPRRERRRSYGKEYDVEEEERIKRRRRR